MFQRQALSLFFASLCATTCLAQTPAKPAPAKLTTCSGLPCFELTLQGHTLHLALDTGDPQSILDTAVATQLNLSTHPAKGQDGNPIPGLSISQIDNFTLGDTVFPKQLFVVMDVSAMVKSGQVPNVDGTLGYTAFKDRILTTDFAHNTFTVSAPVTTTTACTAGTIQLITFGKQGPPIVTTTGFSLNGKPVVAQIDTLWPGTMLIYPPSVAKLNLDKESLAPAVERFPFTDGGVNMTHSDVSLQAFAGHTLNDKASVYFATEGVHVPDALFDATVGMGLLKGRTATFDFHNNCFNLSS